MAGFWALDVMPSESANRNNAYLNFIMHSFHAIIKGFVLLRKESSGFWSAVQTHMATIVPPESAASKCQVSPAQIQFDHVVLFERRSRRGDEEE